MIYFFTKDDKNTPSSRSRAFLIAEQLNTRGIKSKVCYPSLSLVSRTKWPQKLKFIAAYIKILFEIQKGDIIFLQRAVYNKYFFVLIVLYKLFFNRKMIFDFDDAIYLHSFLKTKTLVKLSNIVIVGSHSLKNWAKQYNKNVHIIPTCVIFNNYEKYSCFKREPNKEIKLGWVGNGPAHYENLKILKPVFEKLITNNINFEFILVGALCSKKIYSLFNIIGLNVRFIDNLDWQNSSATPKIIQTFDIGLMPLVSTNWSEGKCCFKAIEYMACGVPVIISAVGENNYLIQDEVNGFLANSTEQWYNKLKLLILKKNLRDKLGKQGQKTVKEKYSYESNISNIQIIIENLCKS